MISRRDSGEKKERTWVVKGKHGLGVSYCRGCQKVAITGNIGSFLEDKH